ncbi:hypothetical protein K469DRAFT_684319 [Zopfia rhizophila CBS 207.26]|uniref:Uncharacterized protein n=1 Tax=Zopfia rhizophila CBS 207.26 TaxID=1314779 RepID=A0A6A6EE29_9PEZI|nr:hypothetical protein K469DRAFT_684319 [Zopfia rhizophila CBS 207.26]
MSNFFQKLLCSFGMGKRKATSQAGQDASKGIEASSPPPKKTKKAPAKGGKKAKKRDQNVWQAGDDGKDAGWMVVNALILRHRICPSSNLIASTSRSSTQPRTSTSPTKAFTHSFPPSLYFTSHLYFTSRPHLAPTHLQTPSPTPREKPCWTQAQSD